MFVSLSQFHSLMNGDYFNNYLPHNGAIKIKEIIRYKAGILVTDTL